MKGKIRGPLFSAAALALIVGPALASCSKPAQENTTAQNATAQEATTQNASESASTNQAGTGQDVSAQNAKGLLKAMSDYIAAQKFISLSYDSTFEVVSKDQQKLQIATSGTVDLNRPDKLRATRKTGFSDTETVYDGTTLSFLGKGKNVYMQAPVTGSIDSVIDQLRDKFHRQLPGADLLVSNVYDALMTDVTDVKDLGSGVIDGKECDHLAFRAKDTDWQIWIAQGEQPYPCRYVITSKTVDQSPQFTLTVRDWKASTSASASDFSFKPPAGATKIDIKDLETLKETSDLPENYRIGAEK